MKELQAFFSTRTGRTLVIASYAAAGVIFASAWDSGFLEVLRSAGGAFLGALGPLIYYLRRQNGEDIPELPGYNDPVPPELTVHRRNAADLPEELAGPAPAPLPPVPHIDLDEDYHWSYDDKERHPGRTIAGCQWCQAGADRDLAAKRMGQAIARGRAGP